MPKPQISFKQEPLRYICNEAFYGVKSILPTNIRNSEKYDKIMAYILGLVSGGAVAEFLGKDIVYPNIVEPLANAIGAPVSLEDVVSHSLAFAAGSALIPFIVAPKKTIEWIKVHSIYASGVAGVMSGASLAAIYELFK